MQDKIFENIFKKFAKGEKLDKYNEIKQFEDIKTKVKN